MCELQRLKGLRSISVENVFTGAQGSMNVYFKFYAAGLCYRWPNLWQSFIQQHFANPDIMNTLESFWNFQSYWLFYYHFHYLSLKACKDYFEFDFLLPGLGEYCGNNPLSLRGGLSVLHHFAATLFADPAVALMDSGRCPARPPLLKQAFSRAFRGGGGRWLFY